MPSFIIVGYVWQILGRGEKGPPIREQPRKYPSWIGLKQNICRSSHRRCSVNKAALNDFAIFTGKHLKACYFIKKRLQHKGFPVNTAKFLRTPISKNICERLLLDLFLTHFMPLISFDTPWKHQKTIFRRDL